jgi:2-oxoglutarate ferredoxin oxidoreductase subunit beta
MNPCGFALGAGARFIARAYDLAQKELPEILKRAHAHKGASFVEIYQNCIVYNDGVFGDFAGKQAARDAVVWLQAGQPTLFAGGTKGLRLDYERLRLEVVPVTDGDWQAAGVLVHDETSRVVAQLLIETPFAEGGFPMALGVIYCDPAPSLEAVVTAQNLKASAGKRRDLQMLLRSGDTWSVAGDQQIGNA